MSLLQMTLGIPPKLLALSRSRGLLQTGLGEVGLSEVMTRMLPPGTHCMGFCVWHLCGPGRNRIITRWALRAPKQQEQQGASLMRQHRQALHVQLR